MVSIDFYHLFALWLFQFCQGKRNIFNLFFWHTDCNAPCEPAERSPDHFPQVSSANGRRKPDRQPFPAFLQGKMCSCVPCRCRDEAPCWWYEVLLKWNWNRFPWNEYRKWRDKRQGLRDGSFLEVCKLLQIWEFRVSWPSASDISS